MKNDGVFQAAVDEAYREHLRKMCSVYMDDRLGGLYEPKPELRLERLRKGVQVLQEARNALLKLKLESD